MNIIESLANQLHDINVSYLDICEVRRSALGQLEHYYLRKENAEC